MLPCGIILIAATAIRLPAAQAASPRTVLAVYCSAEEVPANRARDEAIRRALRSRPHEPVEYFAEYLESDRVPEREASLALREYIGRKYRGQRIDLVLAITDAALQFVLRHRQALFPAAPIVYQGSLIPDAGVRDAGPGLTGVVSGAGFGETVDLALKLHPSTTRVFVIAKRPEVPIESLRAELRLFERRTTVTYLTAGSVSDLMRAVAVVPETSVILYVRHSDTAAWHDSAEVARVVTEASRAPVYVAADGHLGTGAVGGVVQTTEALATRIGEISRQVLDGTPPTAIPIEHAPLVPTFDWRQLRRWGIDDGLLPAGSVIRFRELTTWERHRTAILAVLTVLLVQSGLIATLLFERRTRLRSQVALRESEERTGIAGVSLGVGFWTWEPDDDRLWITRQCAWLLGTDSKKPLSLDAFLDAVRPHFGESARHAFERAVMSGTAYDGEWPVAREDGSVRWIAAATRPSVDSRGRRHVTGVLMDVTARKGAELQAEEQRRELAHLGRVAMLGEMSAALAHELRQPLMAIRSYAQGSLRLIAGRPPALEKLRQSLEAILRAEKHAGGVIDRARALLKREEPRSEELDVNDIVRETLELASVELHGGAVAPTTHLARGLPTVSGDRIELQQVLMNVLMNAYDAMTRMAAHDRRLVVTTSSHEGEVHVRVSDSGPGIAADRIERVFDPFVTTKQDGLGLGLAICRSIVRSHGGEIRAFNNPGGGSTFDISLPRTSPDLACGGNTGAETGEPLSSHRGG